MRRTEKKEERKKEGEGKEIPAQIHSLGARAERGSYGLSGRPDCRTAASAD